jgi:hypothetical protein
MARPQAAPIARDWLGKTLAGILLGFTLALGCSALFIWLAASLPQSARSQLAMWLLAPVWIGVLGGVFSSVAANRRGYGWARICWCSSFPFSAVISNSGSIMRSDYLRIYKSVHTWTGILAGMALFIAFYAGALTIFKDALARWSSAPSAVWPGAGAGTCARADRAYFAGPAGSGQGFPPASGRGRTCCLAGCRGRYGPTARTSMKRARRATTSPRWRARAACR